MKIIQSKVINDISGYVIIPFLESYYNGSECKGSVYKMLERILEIDVKYKPICDKIDQKMRNKLINIATLTISKDRVGGARIKIKKTKKASNMQNINNINNTIGGLMQIYLIRIDDSSKSENELFEELRVNGHLIYNLLKKMGSINFFKK